MIRIPARITILALLLVPGTPGLAGFCKWVDAGGVVHYAESCPEHVDGSAVHTEPPPSPEAVEAAERRSEALRAGHRARVRAPEQQPTEPAAEQGPEVSCDEAFRIRDMLDLQLPVYFDEQLSMNYRDSLHHHWYQGPRIYLDDEARVWQRERNDELIERQCADAQPATPAAVVRFRNAPTLQETIDLLGDAGKPGSPPTDDLCAYAERLAQDIAQNPADEPPDDIRHLQGLQGRHCR